MKHVHDVHVAVRNMLHFHLDPPHAGTDRFDAKES
jgi:hypothetical protein